MSARSVCVSTRLRRAARQAGREYDAALSECGVNVAQFALLRAIEGMREPNFSDLAAETGLDASTLGRNLRVLERLELVAFKAGTDKRTRIVDLTEAGIHTIRDAGPKWAKAQNDLETRLRDLGGRASLFDMLDALEKDPVS